MRTAGIATLRERELSFRKTIESIYYQVNVIYAVLNFYDSAPHWLKDFPNVKYFYGINVLGAAGKMLMAGKAKGYYFGIDDDLQYNSSYISYLCKSIDEYKCIVSLHGKRFDNLPIKSYRRDYTTNARCLSTLFQDTQVHVVGSGCCGWHTDHFNIDISDFKYQNKVDVELSREAHKQGVKMIALAHPKSYLRYTPSTGATVWQTEKDDTVQTQIVNLFKK